MKILLAADDTSSRELMRRTIESETGHDVTEVYDGEEASLMLRDATHRFDVAIIDLKAPQFDSLALAGKIRAIPAWRQLPIILCTTGTDRESVRRAAQLSIRHYIVKPFGADVVVEKIRAVAAELAAQNAGDNSSEIAQRMKVPVSAVPQLTAALLGKIGDWIAAAHRAQTPQEFTLLTIKAHALAGACHNMGLRVLGHELEAVETKFTRDFSEQHGDMLPPSPLEIAAELKASESELTRVCARLRVPVPVQSAV